MLASHSPPRGGDHHHRQQAGEFVDLDREHGDQDRAGHEDRLVDDRFERERRMQQRPGLQHDTSSVLGRRRRSEGYDSPAMTAKRCGHGRAQPACTAVDEPGDADREEDESDQQHRALPELVGQPAEDGRRDRRSQHVRRGDHPGSAVRTRSCTRRAARCPSGIVDIGRSGQETSTRERGGPWLRQHDAVRTKHPLESSQARRSREIALHRLSEVQRSRNSRAGEVAWQDRGHAFRNLRRAV